MSPVTRRAFFAAAGPPTAIVCGWAPLPGVCGAAAVFAVPDRVLARPPLGPYDPGFPRQDADAVRETVGASHGKLERVRELVTARPALAKAAWDWGFGDWESALGAASHTGQREIAALLIEHGARPDIFTFAMLGNLDAVRAICQASPGVQRIPGPHGIPLLSHARAGGEKAAAVVEYLEGLGDAGIEQKSLPLTDAERAAYLGRYALESDDGITFEINEQKGLIAFQRTGEFFRALFNLGDHQFHPTGAGAVRVKFTMEGGRAVGVTITDGGLSWVARRLA